MSGFSWLDVVDETVGGTIVDATPGVKGVIKLTNDLGGDADVPKVLKVNGAAIPTAGTLTTGQILVVSGSSALSYSALDLTNSNSVSGILPNTNLPSATTLASGILKLSGDLGGTATSPSVLKINGTSISAGGSLTTGQILRVTGSSSIDYGALDLTNSSAVSGILSDTNLPNATTGAKGIIQLAGDLGGTVTSPSVLKINGTSIAASPTNNQVLIASGTTSSTWAQIADANISPTAAIASTKLAYSDVFSPALSATTVQSAIDAIKTTAVATAIQRLSKNIALSDLQALGAAGVGTINVGSTLPANARVLGAEINTTQILAGIGLSIAVATVQGSTDIAGSLITAASLLSTGFIGTNGTNQYMTRGAQQITIIITLTGALFNALSGGALTVNIFYAVVS